MAQQHFKRTSPHDLVRVGVITGPGGHTKGIWANNMNPSSGFIRTTGMIMTHVWSLRSDMAQSICQEFDGVRAVNDPREMLGEIDGVLIDDINAISIYPTLSRPFLKAGVPTFVNRPFATSMAKGKEMVETAARYGTALLSASTWEFAESVGDLRAKVADMSEIKAYVAHNSMSDYYTHGLHGVWYIHAVLRDEIQAGRGRVTGAAYLTPNWRTPPGLVAFEHEGTAGPYYGTLQLISGADGNAYMRVFADHKGDAEGKIPTRPAYFNFNTWNALQLAIQQMFETGESPQTGDDLMEKLLMFLLPFYAIMERNGAFVRREELGDWELSNPSEALTKDGQLTDGAFRQPYSDQELSEVKMRLA